MFIAHILHGCLVLFVYVFSLPFIFVMAVNIMVCRRAPLNQSLRVFAHVIHAIYKSVSNLADAFGELVIQRCPAQHAWMKLLLKPLITTAIILGALYFISDCGY